MSVRGKAAIVGIGELPTKRDYPGRSSYSLCAEAAKLAIEDAGLRKEDIDGVMAALRIIGADPDVAAVLVNIFGGLTRADDVATGIVQAKREGLVDQPMVVRLAGTNVEDAGKILDDSGLEFTRADGFAEAAKRAVEAAEAGA